MSILICQVESITGRSLREDSIPLFFTTFRFVATNTRAHDYRNGGGVNADRVIHGTLSAGNSDALGVAQVQVRNAFYILQYSAAAVYRYAGHGLGWWRVTGRGAVLYDRHRDEIEELISPERKRFSNDVAVVIAEKHKRLEMSGERRLR